MPKPQKLLALFLGTIMHVAASDAAPDVSGRGWRPTRIDLAVSVDPEQWRSSVTGELTLELIGRDESSGPTIGVNLRRPLARFESVQCEGATVELNHRHPEIRSARLAHVRFAVPKRKGDTIRVRFACAMPGHDMLVQTTPDAAIASWTSGWYPIPLPEEDAGLQSVNRAPGSMTFRLPKGWSAVTGGKLTSRRELPDADEMVWDVPQSIARSYAAAPYTAFTARAQGVDASVHLLTNAPNAQRHVEALVQAVDALQERLGPYPFPGFAIAEVPVDVGDFGASSEQGFIMVKPNFLEGEKGNLALFAHEAAHAWWGNTVGTTAPAGIMCDEALAQYGSVIAIEKVEGAEGVRSFLEFSRPTYIHNQCAKGYFELVRAGRDIPLMRLTSGGTSHTLADAKGHWVYHMLRHRVGDEVFFSTLRRLIQEYAHRSMSLADVREAFVVAAPDKGLPRFFEQWLDRAGAPVLDARIEPAGDTSRIVIVQAGDLYDLALDLALTFDEGRVETLRAKLRERETTVEARGRVVKIDLDPGREWLLWRPEYGPRPALR